MAKPPTKDKHEAPQQSPQPSNPPTPSIPPTIKVLPMLLQIGDGIVDERGEWRVVGKPYTTAVGKTARVRVELKGQPHIHEIRAWGAHERVSVRRSM
jgi:hypothetical protein